MFHRALSGGSQALRSRFSSISWKPIGKPQQTLASEIVLAGVALHSGETVTAKLLPEAAGQGRYFVVGGVGGQVTTIAAAIGNAEDSPLCTTLSRAGARVRTVEHLLSALEACGVDNCRIEISGGNEVPVLDGSAKEWVEAIQQVGLCVAEASAGNYIDKLAPFLNEPIYVSRNDSFIFGFPSPEILITYGIDFSKVPSIGCQWFSSLINASVYLKEIAPARTFCVYEEVEKMRSAGLIQGGSAENAIVCSTTRGWLNPPLRYHDEPCRHKVLDLVGDFSLLAHNGNQGLLNAHIIAYKAGHSLHSEFIRCISKILCSVEK
ncbi:probable UDP-3-O-acyl-N-acetylglucosamine deacetylase 1, mitochondrial isoform X1 [Dioscorea cayenensis subsp. rotundata]|uniref:UDP-3-O-acyl-N-acetylglucosamine deacetylase n=1 Tax=Dioscorea cayennensis subsp. rotundata TaxID=55577 RepID=A0AB40BBQ3_DIOCR|nr:probable UDP-3-O-acyl-N-acetylglucosamine deacetylase 1, mitochondrial isoform X1 [Dioscorea cayenensis subsp. rotundata]